MADGVTRPEVLMRRCPSFAVCSTPWCPLDVHRDRRGQRQKGEEACRAHKPTRLRVVAEALAEGGALAELAAQLTHGGLTPAEAAGAAAWAALTPEEREARTARLRETAFTAGTGAP